MRELDVQAAFLESVKARAKNPRTWVDEISQVINKSKFSVYKKIQGETRLSLEEVVLIAEHFGVHLDPILRPQSTLSFEFPFYGNQFKGRNYLDSIADQLADAGQLTDVSIWHSGIELPFIHDYNFPEITAFKFYIHNRTAWRDDRRKLQKFKMADYRGPAFLNQFNNILDKYYRIPTIEFWNTLMLDITLSQIKYALESDLFEEPVEARALCTRLLEYVDHMQYMADLGYKVNAQTDESCAEFSLYHNEIAHSNNLILMRSKEREQIFLSFGNPHFMHTTDESAVAYSKAWFESLRNNSQLITRESRKSRIQFFSEWRSNVNRTKLEIDTFLSVHAL